MGKSKERIEKLKSAWLATRHWNLEDTEGFEDHKKDLYIFSLETRLRESQAQNDEYFDFFERLKGFII